MRRAARWIATVTAELFVGARRPILWACVAVALLLAGWGTAAPWVDAVAGLVE